MNFEFFIIFFYILWTAHSGLTRARCIRFFFYLNNSITRWSIIQKQFNSRNCLFYTFFIINVDAWSKGQNLMLCRSNLNWKLQLAGKRTWLLDPREPYLNLIFLLLSFHSFSNWKILVLDKNIICNEKKVKINVQKVFCLNYKWI